MVRIHSEKTEQKSLFQKLFFPLLIKMPIHAAVIILLIVSAFYVYRNIDLSSRSLKLPAKRFSTGQYAASPGLSLSDQELNGLRKEENSSLPSQQIPQSQAYKSLDMKLEYTAPSLPVRKDEETATTFDKANRAKQAAPAGESVRMEKTTPASEAPACTNLQDYAVASKKKTPHLEVEQRSFAIAEKTRASAKEPVLNGLTTSSRQAEAVLMKKIGDFFSNHDLPRNEKDLKYDVSKLQALPANESWLDERMLKKLVFCKSTYLVEVRFSETHMKYIYCGDNASIKLLFKVEKKNGRWIKIE